MPATAALLGAAGIGAVSKIASSALGFAYDMAKMQKQYDYKMQYDREKWKNNMQGMLDAGINPAAMFGGSGGFKAGTARASAGYTNSMHEATNGGFVTARQLPRYVAPVTKQRVRGGPATMYRR